MLRDFQLDYTYPNDSTTRVTTSQKRTRETEYVPTRVEERKYRYDLQPLERIRYSITSSTGQLAKLDRTIWEYNEQHAINQTGDLYWGEGGWNFFRRTQYYYPSGLMVEPANVAESLSIYPNPTDGPVRIAGLTAPAEVLVYDMNGRQLLRFTNVTDALDLSALEPGFYLLKVNSGCRQVRKL